MQTSDKPIDRVLVIDDDAVMREVLSLLLEADGHSVITAGAGDVALALLATLPPEQLPTVILTDLKMPGLSQGALATRLRGASSQPALLVAMSGSEPAAGEAAAFDAFLRKPFTVADLEAAVSLARTHAAGVQSSAPKSGRGAKKTPVPAHNEILNETVYATFSAAIGAALPQFQTMILKDTLARIKRIRSAAASHDEEALVHEAHTIKGSCSMLGATELRALAEQVETGGLAGSSLINDFEPALERLRRILDKQAGRPS